MIVCEYDPVHNSFEIWMERNGDELDCIFAENGADREMDFDYETDAWKIFIDREGVDIDK